MGAWEQARQGRFDIDFLMIAAAFGAALIGDWPEGALLLFLFTLSGALETFAMGRTRKAIESLSKLRPEVATVRRGSQELVVPVAQLEVGDLVVVKPGERLPVDGAVVSGSSSIDQSAITGESIPVSKWIGDSVFAGTINGGGALEVRVTKPAGETTLSKIVTLVAEAQEDATPTQQFIDRFSQPYTYAVIGATLLAIILPVVFLKEPFDVTLYRAMTLLVVASPCALVISTPASALSAIAAAARSGVLFKGGAYLELLGQVDIMAFDKTGTLTPGRPVVTNIHPLTGHTENGLLAIAASAETLSEHHIGKAIVEQARARGLELQKPLEFQAVAGEGIIATFEIGDHAETLYIGNERLFDNRQMDLSPAIRMIGQALQKQGKSVMLVVRRSRVEDTLGSERDWEVMGYIAVADTLRNEAADAVRRLRQEGIRHVAMITGDNANAAHYIRAAGEHRRSICGPAARREAGADQEAGHGGQSGDGGRRRQRRPGAGYGPRRHRDGCRRHRRCARDGRHRADVERPGQAAVCHQAEPQGGTHHSPERLLCGGCHHYPDPADDSAARHYSGFSAAAAVGRGRARRQHLDRGRQRPAFAWHASGTLEDTEASIVSHIIV